MKARLSFDIARPLTATLISGVALVLVSCQGQLIEPGAGLFAGDHGTNPDRQAAGLECNELNAGEAPTRRLSNAEYRNTITDLTGNATLAAQLTSKFVSETESLGFRNNARFLQVNSVLAQQYMDAAEEIAKTVRANPASVVPCTAEAGKERECATRFIRDFGRKAYRRPLSTDEIARYERVYDDARKQYPHAAGIEWITFAILQSPNFLHRVEFGASPDGKSFVRPTSYEMASRLSYLLWQSMPDDELFRAAELNQLSTDAEVAAQARRMLQDEKSRRIYQFFEEWLDLDELQSMQRDRDVYTSYTSALPSLLAKESKAFIEHVLWEEGGSLQALFTAPYTFVNADLAKHYGISGVTGSELQKVELPGRAGVFTLGGVVAVHDKQTRSSIVNRGLRIRTEVMCHTIGAPPADIVLDLPEVRPGLTQRDTLQAHREEELCASCHNKMDPLGIAFESFDATGRLRTQDEHGNPVDSSTEITHTRDMNGPISGAIDLAAKLSASQEVRECLTKQTFRFFYGRGEKSDDACSLKQLNLAFEKSDHSLQELIVALTQTDAFLYRPASVGGEP